MGLVADFLILEWIFRKTLHEEMPPPTQVALHEDVTIRRMLWPLLILLFVSGAFFAGINPAMGAAAGASLLLVSKHTNARLLFSRVDVSLLVFFIGLFVVLAGGEIVGVNDRLLMLSEHLNLRNTIIFTGVVTLLSNLVSNVPAVLLLKPIVVHQGSTHAAWLLLAMASTLAGNLTITGSVANIIVVESARDEAHVSFWQYLRVGVPVTLVTLLMGWVWLHFFGR